MGNVFADKDYMGIIIPLCLCLIFLIIIIVVAVVIYNSKRKTLAEREATDTDIGAESGEEGSTTCQECGAQNTPENNFCEQCGNKL